jgi:hypothetical protein
MMLAGRKMQGETRRLDGVDLGDRLIWCLNGSGSRADMVNAFDEKGNTVPE